MISRLGALASGWLLLLLFSSITSAIYADEAYETDWHQALLGKPRKETTFFHQPSSTSKAALLYTLSEKHVVGAINPKDGSIVWRQPLANLSETAGDPSFLKPAASRDYVVSGFKDRVQSWNAADGRLAWQWKSTGNVKSVEILPTSHDREGVVVLTQDGAQQYSVRFIDGATGHVKWEFKDESGDASFGISTALDKIYLVSLYSALLKGSKVKVTTLDSKDGAAKSTVTLSSENEIQSPEAIKLLQVHPSNPLIAWSDKDSKVVKVNGLGSKKVATIDVPQEKGDSIESLSVHAVPNAANQAHVLIHLQTRTSHRAEVLHVDLAQGSAIPVYSIPSTNGYGAFSASIVGDNGYFTQTTRDQAILYSLTSGDPLSTRKVMLQGQNTSRHNLGISFAVSEIVPKASSQHAVRSAVASSNGNLELLKDGKSIWIRHESRAGIVAAQWASSSRAQYLAEEIAHESQASVFRAYVHRLKRHGRDLQYFPAWARDFAQSVAAQLSGGKIPTIDSVLQRDSFGFHKILVVAKEDGSMSALDVSRQGLPIWSMQVAKNLEKGQKWQVLSIVIDDNIAVVRGAEGEFVRIDVIDGKVLQYQPGRLLVKLKTTISLPSVNGSSAMVPVYSDGKIPDFPGKRSLAGSLMVITSGEDGSLQGNSLVPNQKPEVAWQFKPGPNEIVATTATRPAQDPVASIGKALGNRNVLYKYLSRNLLLVITANTLLSTAIVTLLETSSGRELYTATHSNIDITKPIISTMSENWFAYSFYSTTFPPARNSSASSAPEPSRSYQLIVSELFESSIPNDRGPLGNHPNLSSIHPSSPTKGLLRSDPHVLSLAFTIPGPISSMSVSSSLQGITPRTLLCVLPDHNSIMAIPRSVIDPRRPVGRDPTPAEAEEGLFRYSPFIDFEPKWMLNHRREVMGIQGVVTTPSRLESTTLLFTYGALDLFGTRVQPIGGFDILGKGFGKVQLVGTVLAFWVGTAILGPLVSLLASLSPFFFFTLPGLWHFLLSGLLLKGGFLLPIERNPC